MIGSMGLHMYFVDTATIPTFWFGHFVRSRDDRCVIANGVRKKELLFVKWFLSVFFLFKKMRSYNQLPLVYPATFSICCSTREDKVFGTLARCGNQRLGLFSSRDVERCFNNNQTRLLLKHLHQWPMHLVRVRNYGVVFLQSQSQLILHFHLLLLTDVHQRLIWWPPPARPHPHKLRKHPRRAAQVLLFWHIVDCADLFCWRTLCGTLSTAMVGRKSHSNHRSVSSNCVERQCQKLRHANFHRLRFGRLETSQPPVVADTKRCQSSAVLVEQHPGADWPRHPTNSGHKWRSVEFCCASQLGRTPCTAIQTSPFRCKILFRNEWFRQLVHVHVLFLVHFLGSWWFHERNMWNLGIVFWWRFFWEDRTLGSVCTRLLCDEVEFHYRPMLRLAISASLLHWSARFCHLACLALFFFFSDMAWQHGDSRSIQHHDHRLGPTLDLL